MTGEYGLRLIPLHGGGLRFEVLSGDTSAATDMPFREDVTGAVAAILSSAGIASAVFENGTLTVLEGP
jgi:hypothetical protein